MLSYQPPRITVQQVLQHGGTLHPHAQNTHTDRVLNRIKTCRTAALGYHVFNAATMAANTQSTSIIAAATGTAPTAVHSKNNNG